MEGTGPALFIGRARSAGFRFSCEPAVGQLLAVLAAHLPAGARVLEFGTGAGVGTAWIASGLLPRADVTVITIEKDPQTAALAAHGAWPQFIDLPVGVAALAPHGLLVIDGMTAIPEWATGQHASRPTSTSSSSGRRPTVVYPVPAYRSPVCTRCWCGDLNLNPRRSAARRAFSPSLGRHSP